MSVYSEKNFNKYDPAIIDAVDMLFEKAHAFGLVEYKIAFEDRIDTINDMFENANSSGILTAEEFEKIYDPEKIIDEIAKRVEAEKKVLEEKSKNTNNNSNSNKDKKELTLKQIFDMVRSEIKKSGDEQDEKVYFEAGRAIGSKIDKTARNFGNKISNGVRSIWKRK